MSDKEAMTVDQFEARRERERAGWSKLRCWLADEGAFGWNYWHLLTHPWKVPHEAYYRVKWFFQRGWRGYSDCDAWGLCDYLAKILPSAIENHVGLMGHPEGMTHEEWQAKLKAMADGFRAFASMDDVMPNDPRYPELEKQWKEGSELFIQYYGHLWD